MSKATKTLTRSFAGGLIAEEIYGRADLAPYQMGLKKCENFVIKTSGAATKRPGFRYVCKLPLASSAPYVFNFEKDSDTSFALVFFDSGIWFYKGLEIVVETPKVVSSIAGSAITFTAAHGYSVGDYIAKATSSTSTTAIEDGIYVVTAVSTTTIANDTATVVPFWSAAGDTTAPTGSYFGKIYQITTTISESELPSMRVSQSDLTLSIQVEGAYPRELTYIDDNTWTYGAVTFAAQVIPPGSENPYLGVSPTLALQANLWTGTSASTNINHTVRYCATSVSDDGEESIRGEDALHSQYMLVLSASTAAPAVFTSATAHGLIVGDELTLWGFTGTGAGVAYSTFNGKRYRVGSVSTVTVANDSVSLIDTLTGEPVSGVGFQTYTANSGRMMRIGNRVDLTVAGHKVAVHIPIVSGISRYNIYKQDSRSKLYGFAGTIEVGSAYRNGDFYVFFDDNVAPDMTRFPPEEWNPFSTANDCPTAVGNHNQRRVFGGSINDPQRMWLTPIGFPSSMNQHFPILEDDAYDFRIAAQTRQKIQHILSLGDMLVLTTAGVWQVEGALGGFARKHSSAGATDTNPVECESTVVYIGAGINRPFEVAYSQDGSGGYTSVDIGVFSPDIFDGYTITSLAYVRGPTPVLWCTRNDGVLMSCTYQPGQDIRAWAVHSTDGFAVSVASVKDAGIERLYLSIRRDVDGVSTCMLERLAGYNLLVQNDAFFVDSGTAFSGSATTTFGGLWHLEGETVVALCDGVVVRDRVVTNGTLTVPVASIRCSVGRPYVADLETLPIAFNTAGGGMGMLKNPTEVNLRVFKSNGIWVGHNFSSLFEYKPEVAGTYSTPEPLISAEINMPIDTSWETDGTVCVRSIDPLPLTVSALSIELAVGA